MHTGLSILHSNTATRIAKLPRGKPCPCRRRRYWTRDPRRGAGESVERPANDFGNNSGLELAISKQIVEAHDGAIWAENIRPTQMDATSAPLGARFVVGLPL